MENNNGRKVFNPIAMAREQAKINKQKQENNSATNPNLDIFGNSEAGSIPTPVVEEPVITEPVLENTDTEITEDPILSVNADPIILGGDALDSTDEYVEPLVFPEDDTVPAESIGATNTADINTNPTIVPEEPTKDKFKKRVKVINSNDAVITSDDVRESRAYAWLAYILFFIPLLINKTNAFVRHNANEGLEINIVDLLAGILLLLNVIIDSSNTVVTFLFMIGPTA